MNFKFTTKNLAIFSLIFFSVGLFFTNSASASTIKAPPSNLGLVGYWPMNEGVGTIAGDASGNGNVGTLTGGPTWANGKRGGAVSFDGSNDFISIPHSSIYNVGANDFTISWWEYRTSNTNGKGAIVRDTTVNYPGYLLGYSAGAANLQIYMTSNGSSWDIANAKTLGTVTLNTWNHFMVTRSGTTFTAYKNGTQTDTWTSSGTIRDGVSGPRIGVYNTQTYFFSGVLDDVRIYNRALSTGEITTLYGAKEAVIGKSQSVGSLATGLVGHWSLDGGKVNWSSSTAGTALDSSGNSNTGTLTNMSQATTPTRGVIGQALNFDGANDYVIVSDNDTLDSFTGLTISFWLYITNIASEPSTVNKYNDTGNQRGYAMGVNADSSLFFWYSSDGTAGTLATWKSAAGSIAPNVWQHVTGVMDPSTNSVRYYINGVYSTTTKYNAGPNPSVTFNSTAPLTIGAYVDGTFRLNGKMDDVRIYNRVLTTAEIKRLYNLGRPTVVNAATFVPPVVVFSPSDLSGLRFWLKADAITGLNDNDLIPAGGWLDQSGNSMDFLPFGGRPVRYQTNVINGLPAVDFPSSASGNGGLQSANGTDLNDITGDFSIFAVWKMDSYYGPDMVFHKGDGATAAGTKFALLARWNGDLKGAFNYYVGSSGAGPQFNDDLTWRQGDGVRSGSAASVRINRGAQTASGTLAGSLNSVTAYKPTLGALSSGAFPADINIAEVIFYDRAVTGADLTNVETYLYNKYGL